MDNHEVDIVQEMIDGLLIAVVIGFVLFIIFV